MCLVFLQNPKKLNAKIRAVDTFNCKIAIVVKALHYFLIDTFIQDVQYGDIDYMDEQRDFTYDLVTYNGLPDYVRQLKAGGKHYVIILVSAFVDV